MALGRFSFLSGILSGTSFAKRSDSDKGSFCIGVYFKEDFNNLRDLRDRIRERFTNKKRKARRMARRTTRAAEKAAEEAEKKRRQEPADTLSPFGYVKGKEDE